MTSEKVSFSSSFATSLRAASFTASMGSPLMEPEWSMTSATSSGLRRKVAPSTFEEKPTCTNTSWRPVSMAGAIPVAVRRHST